MAAPLQPVQPNSPYDCIILGAGFAGLSAALNLSNKNSPKKIRCAVVDASENLGGLVASYDFGSYKIEKFYHHLQLADDATVELAKQLGLASQLRWLPASVGYLSGKQIYPLNTPLQIARFPLLSFKEKWRLAKLVRLAKSLENPSELDNVKAHDWVIHNCGANVYENFFAPLLRGKFGDDVEEISAAWLVGKNPFSFSSVIKG